MSKQAIESAATLILGISNEDIIAVIQGSPIEQDKAMNVEHLIEKKLGGLYAHWNCDTASHHILNLARVIKEFLLVKEDIHKNAWYFAASCFTESDKNAKHDNNFASMFKNSMDFASLNTSQKIAHLKIHKSNLFEDADTDLVLKEVEKFAQLLKDEHQRNLEEEYCLVAKNTNLKIKLSD